MSRPLRLAVTGAALAVLVTAAPADAAWETVGGTYEETVDTARLSARLVPLTGTGALGGGGTTYTQSSLLGLGNTTLLDVVNGSSVTTPVRVRLSSSGLLSGVTLRSCAAAWSGSSCLAGEQQLYPASGTTDASAPDGWVSPMLAVEDGPHLRLSMPGVAMTVTVAVAPAPVARDRTAG